jgi:pimeloyl-ACP methyl ester carboxylesterase
MSDFLLLHGASHAAWCWHPTVAELERRGHQALAVDLPIDDPEAGAERYAEVAAAAARARFDGPVVVVGHSLSGIVIPLLPELLQVDELVFLCSPLPIPGVSMIEQWEREPDMLVPAPTDVPQPAPPPGDASEDPAEQGLAQLRARAIPLFYADCPAELATTAAQHLRHQEMTPMTEPSPVAAWPPQVPYRYILTRDDRAMSPDWSRRAVPSRLGVVPIELDGSHSPFLSRPTELVDVLLADGAAPTTG